MHEEGEGMGVRLNALADCILERGETSANALMATTAVTIDNIVLIEINEV